MATLLSKILPNDIANHIYKIVIVEFIEQKITIYTYNLYLITEKHLRLKPIDVKISCYLLTILPDINKLIQILTFLNEKYITPYIKFEIRYNNDFKIIVNKWITKLQNMLNKKLTKEPYLANNSNFLLLQKKILLLDNLIN